MLLLLECMMSTRKLTRFYVGGMACAFCAATIEKGLRQVDGVSSSKVLVESGEVFIRHDPTLIDEGRLKKELEKLGYYVFEGKENMANTVLVDSRSRAIRTWGTAAVAFAIAIPMMFPNVFLSATLLPSSYGLFATVANFIIASVALFYFALPIHKGALVALRKRILNEHVLYAVAGFGAYALGIIGFGIPLFRPFFFIATLLTGLHLSAGWLGAKLRFNADRSVKQLMDLRPPMARIIRGAGDATPIEVPVSGVRTDDLIVVRPGERIPLDGVVVNGDSEVAEAILTGESTPVTKREGSEVLGGSTNGSGVLRIRVTSEFDDSYISKILGIVNSARESRSTIMTFFDRVVDRIWVPLVLLVTSLTFVAWAVFGILVSNSTFWETGIIGALLVSVIGYPCAIGFSSPSVGLSVFSEYADNGVLVKDTTVFERLKGVKTVVFDKTGTLTYGIPRVIQTATPAEDEGKASLLKHAASLENESTHPVARAIVDEANKTGVRLVETGELAQISGEGVTGTIEGRHVMVGRPEFLRSKGFSSPEIQGVLSRFHHPAKSPVVVGIDGHIAGAFDVTDTIRPEAKWVVAKLEERGLQVLMLTGDTEATAAEISKELGGIEYLARRTPTEKIKVLEDYKKKGRILMIGDGLNDTAALAAADVGIATAASIDISKDVADAVLVSSNLGAILAMVQNANAVARASTSNILLALAFNAVGIPLAILGVLSASDAMLIMVSSLFAVFANAYLTKLRIGGRLVELSRDLSTIGRNQVHV